MAETKPTSLLEIGLAKSKKVAEQRKKTTSTTPTSEQSAATATQPVVEKRGETPEERATYARLMGLNDLGASSMALELSKMDSAKEQMNKTAANVAKLQSEMKPQEHDPLKVDALRIMQQNSTQRAVQKMVDEPTSVEGVEDKSKAAAKYFGFEPYILKPDVQSRKAMRDVFDSTDPLYESQGLAAAFKYIDTLPTNEEGKIVVDGVPYSRMELAQGLAPQIVSANSGSLFANNATYRDDMAKRMGYKNMDSYLAALDQRLAVMQKDLANHVSAQHAIQTPFNDMAGLEALATQERAGAKVIRDLRDQIKSMRAGEGGFEQFFKGLNEGFDAVNMATLGVADLASEYKQNVVFNKMLNGETLTPEERILADALNIKSDLDALREAQGQSWYNNIGAGVGYIGEIAPQFVGPMLAAKGLFKTINVGAKGAWEMTKKAASKGFTNALKTGLGATMRVGGKSLNNIARFQINGMLTAPLQASTYSRFLEKRNAQYSIKDGKVTYTPTDAWRDLVDTWIEQGAEVGSELFGVSLEKFTSASLAAIGRNIGLGKMMRKIGGSVRNVETSKAMRYVKSGATKAGQQLFGYAGGVLPETLSEIYGDLTSEMFKSVLTGNGSFEEFKNPTYWATAFALSGIYGGAMSVLPSMVDYASYMRDISALGNIKKKILSDGKIEHADLKNALIALSAGGSIKDATEHLAELDWKNGGYSLEEIGYAMDYIRAEAMQQVRMGEATESQRLQRFGNVAQNIEAHAYRDEEGMPSGSMVMAVDKDGNSYHILEGDYSNKEATLKALNSEGKVVPLLASNIEGLSKASIADVTLFYYQQMFSTEFNLQRLESVEYAIERMDNPTMAQVADVAKRVGIVMPKEGDTITLVDGRTAKVTSISDDLGIMAEMTDGEGNISQVTIPIMQILSSNTYIAEAQKLQNAEDALELAQAEEAQAEAEDAVEEGDATADVATEESNGIIGTEVTLPNGNKGTIVEVDGGDVIVDMGRGVDAYEVYSKEELGMTEATETTTPQPTQTTAEQTTGEVTPEQATEALNEIADIKRVPTLEDGSIDYDAIDDAETFAKHFEHDMGSREEAIEGVKEMREQAVADLAEAEKKGKKARSANEKVANKAERQRLAERIAFYDNVLDIYTPKAEAPATPIESAPQVDTTPSQTEAQSPVEAIEGVQPSETTAEDQVDGYSKYNEELGRPVGLQHNELSERLEEKTRRMINDVATAFGVEVIFQREVRSSAGNLVNGKIDGSTVYFNWGSRVHTLAWLMGHEFTHRMKSLSPEAYEKLRDAVRVHLGEGKWNRLIEEQRKIYEERENPEEILSSAESAAIWKEAKEQTKREDGSYNEEAAKKLYNKKVAEARREAYIEEVVCDEVGVLARDHKAFDRFLRSEHVRNDGKLLSWLRKVWQSIKNAFSHDARTFNKVMKTLDELINVSTAEVAKGVEPPKGAEKNSLSAPVFYSNAQYAVQNIKQEKATPEQWLKMIEKNGGLKAGEDKWLGLSDWLKASDKKTLTKDEVLQYIADNNFVIEEVEYSDVERFTDRDIYDTDEFTDLLSSLQIYDEDDNASFNIEEYNRLRESNADFEEGFSLDYWGESLDVKDPVAAARYLGLTEGEAIHGTRLEYTTAGLENKREIALVVPSIEPYNRHDEIHFGDAGEGRAVAWIRFGETTIQEPHYYSPEVTSWHEPYKNARNNDVYKPMGGAGKNTYVVHRDGMFVLLVNDRPISTHDTLDEAGAALNEYHKQNPIKLNRNNRVLVIDEIQSKRHQDARDKGYSDKRVTQQELYDAQEAAFEAVMEQERALADKYGEDEWVSLATAEEMEEYERLRAIDEAATNAYENYDKGVPSAPFEKNWAELAFKRMLRYAAENGYDYVAWTTGDQQADRYNIGAKIERIEKTDDYSFDVHPVNSGYLTLDFDEDWIYRDEDDRELNNKHISEIFGKDVAKRLQEMPVEEELSGDGLRIGGEGMRAFYDQMLPSFVKKYTKKWGAEVGEVTMPDLEENNTMHAVNVTDSMRESVMQGQAKFSLQDIANDVREYDATNGTELYDWLNFVESGSITKNKTQFHIANTGKILNEYGIKGKINVTRKAINAKRHTDNDDHKLGVSGWAFLVATINNPLVITRYNNEPNSYRIYTIAEINGKNICAGVDVNATNGVEITKITTAFGRDITKIEASSKEKEIYRNENAAEQISGSDNSHLYARLLSTANIIQNFQNPKIEAKNSLITPEMDASYLDAVERGDMETAQKMVMEAAKLAMPNTKVVDEDGNPKVVYHGTPNYFNAFSKEMFGTSTDRGIWGNGFYFSEDAGYAKQYQKRNGVDGRTLSLLLSLKNPLFVSLKDGGNEGAMYFHQLNEKYFTDDIFEDAAKVDENMKKAQQQLSDNLIADGYDGVVIEYSHPTIAQEYVVFEPNQIKSADPVTYDDAGNIIPLSERFNPEKEDIRYSMQAPSLLGVHNISLDKLRKVIKMGGLANPSVAVIDVDKQTHDDYGEYSLILPKNMVDARQGKNAGTWAGDAWTPTYPQVVRRMTDDKAISRFYKDIDALPEAIRNRVRLDFDSFMEGRSANALAYWYLFEKGNAPALVYIPSRYSEDIANVVEEVTNGSFSMYGLTSEERAKCLDAYIAVKFNGDRAAYEEEMQATIDRLTETIETKKSDRVKKWAQETIDSIKEYGFDYDDVAKFIRDVGYDVREKGKVNVDATITAAREQIETNSLNSDYDAWRDNLDERYGIEEYIFDGYTNSGNRRYLPHTVENASKWMKKQGRQGAVATFPSFGTFVAVSIPKMTTLESIRKRKALLGKSKEEYNAFREKWENVYYELGKKLQPDAKSFDDYGYWRLIEAVGQKNPREFIKKQYGIELSEEDMAQLNEMLDAIRTEYPARYFETKFERPLQLSDFVAAVVPNDVPMDVYGRLSDANVEIFEYEKGDSNSRAEAMQKASQMENVRFSLQTFDAVANYITYEARAFGITTPIFVVENAEEFKQALSEIGVRNVDDYEDAAGIYDPDNDAIYIRADISEYERVFFETLLHENTHAVTRSIFPNLKAVLSTLNEEEILAYRDSKMSSMYKNDSTLSVLNEIISYFVGEIPQDKLIDYYQGEIDIEDNILSDFKISLIENELKRKFIAALRPVILENLEIQKRNYNERKGKAIVIAREYMGPYGAKDEKSKSGSVNTEHEGGYDARGEGKAQGGVLQKVGAQENQSVAPTRYSLQSGDMPFFNDNGDIITFDNTDITGEDYDAVELRSPMPTTPRTTEEVIKAHLSARHNAAKERIRRESRVLRDAVRKQYRDEQVRRREGVETMRTNAAKVDYIIGAPIETLDYEAQVLAMIAMGTLSISWESLSKELGVKSGDKKSYRHITNGATATLDAVVHAWWESINGYENGIDTQDLRNALIDVLMHVPTANGALSILEDRFDHALRNRDEALEDIDREEDRLIAEEEARYNEQMTTLSDPARMSEYVRQYEQTVGFHEELTAIEGTLRKMDSELKAVRKRAERAQMRNRAGKQKQFDKSKEIIGKQREFYKDKLAEQRASFKEVREAIAESKRALLEALSTYEQLGFNKQEVRSLVDAVNKARSMADINKVRVKIENVILNVSIREKRRHMDQMLNLRLPSGELVETWVSKQIHDGKMSVADGKRILADMFRGTNANGVRVAKYVDDETARVMDYLRKNLIVPNHGGHYQDKKDADGNVIGREYVPSREVTEGADELMASNEKKMNELLEKKINGDITEEEGIELLARQLYTPYLFAANARANVKEVRAEGEKMYEDIQRKKAEMGDAYTKEMRDADYAALEANSLHLVEAKTAYDEALTEYNETLSNVIMSGRDKLREFREAKEAHKAEVVSMAIRTIGGEARTNASQPTVAEKIAAWNRTSFHSTYWTFDSACREIDRFAPNGEGEFYKHFMGGMTKASNDFFTRTDNHVQDICDAVRRITGSKRDPRRALRAFMRKADMTTVGSITYKNDKGKMEAVPLRISNALFTLAMWDQAQYREIMEKHGITKEQMEALKAKIESIDGRYIDFMEWVIDIFLPSTRLEYNEVHKQLFGASMDNIENYFPAKVVEGYRAEDIAKVDSGLPSTMTGSIITRQHHNNMPKFNQSFFSVLLNHIQNMDQWASFSPLVEDLNAVISNPEFKRLVNTHKAGVEDDRTGKGSLWQIFKDTSAVAIGSYNCKTPDADSMIAKLTGSWAASNISWRFSTALKQLSGLTAVAVSGFGKTQGMFLKNMMLSPLAVKWAMENSPMLKKRFGDRFAGNEALMRKYGQDQAKGLDLRKGKLKDGLERVNDFIRFLTVDVGMTPNAAVDALVVAITMKTVYDVELSNLTKGKPESATEEQKNYAMMKAEIFANETQQSAEGAYLSVPQAQRSVATAVMTTYLNASFASHRLRVQGVQDIYRWLSPKYRKEIDDRYGKGAARKAAGKGLARLLAGLSIDATFILMSRAVGQGLWRLIIDWFDDTEDDDDEADPIDWSDIGWEIGIQTAFGGILGGNIITSLRNGFMPAGMPALEELKKLGYDLFGWTEAKIKKGDWSIDLNFWALGEIIFKYGYGLDPETMLNIARGIEGICRDKDPMAAMKILNTPQSMVNIIAGPRRDNETVKEYVERRARLEVLFAQPKYSELFDDEGKFIGKNKYAVVGGAKNYRLKSLFKEYNERQRATVMSKYFSPSEVAEFKRIDSKYKAVVEPLGWEVGKNPVDDMVDKTSKRYKYPNGLTNVHYAALKKIATEAERTRRAQDRWIGTDMGFADLIRTEYSLRSEVIKGRKSVRSAKTAKEKIDRAEKQRKKNQKK